MKAEEYYKNIESKWQFDYPSSKNLNEVWRFYKECGYKSPQKTIGDILDKVKWRKNKVLDFGCDNGLMLKFICESYKSVAGTGIDINSAAIETAQRTYPELEFLCFDGLNIPFGDKIFDLVFVSAVIKHIRYKDRSHVYKELGRVANKVFFIEVDAKAKEAVMHESWTFYHSYFDEEFRQYFQPIEVVHEAGDILGLYNCK